MSVIKTSKTAQEGEGCITEMQGFFACLTFSCVQSCSAEKDTFKLSPALFCISFTGCLQVIK